MLLTPLTIQYKWCNLAVRKLYLKPIAACHTNANSKKKTGIIGRTSIIGLKTT